MVPNPGCSSVGGGCDGRGLGHSRNPGYLPVINVIVVSSNEDKNYHGYFSVSSQFSIFLCLFHLYRYVIEAISNQ